MGFGTGRDPTTVLNALRHQRFAIGWDASSPRTQSRAQRLTASEVRHIVASLGVRLNQLCSTPYGIRGSPCWIDTLKGVQHLVLNALRHQRFAIHWDVMTVHSMPISAQRLTASEVRHLFYCIHQQWLARRAQRLTASEVRHLMLLCENGGQGGAQRLTASEVRHRRPGDGVRNRDRAQRLTASEVRHGDRLHL